MSLKQDCARHDLQARRGCRKKLASPQWPQPVAENHPRYKVHRRNRGCQIPRTTPSRLLSSTTNIPGSPPRRKGRSFFFSTQKKPGFLLKVKRSGEKPFYQLYTERGGGPRQFRIGPADVLSLSA